MRLRFLLFGLLPVVFISLLSSHGFSQTMSAGEYLDQMGAYYNQMEAEQWAYTSALARGQNAKKIDSKRQDLLNSTLDAKKQVLLLPPFEGDAMLRDSMSKFLMVKYAVLNEDYDKIVNLEAVAEQSYDLMEAYLLAQKEAGEKLWTTGEKVIQIQQEFADKHNINLTDGGDTEYSLKLEVAAKVFDQYNELFLFYFKCFKQDIYLDEAIQEEDINAMEQNANALAAYADDGLKSVEQSPGFNGDKTLAWATRDILKFYKKIAEEEFPFFREFFQKKDHLDEVKEAFDTKAEDDRTQADVDQYNLAIRSFNESIATFNETNTRLFEQRNRQIEHWHEVAQKFLNLNCPN